jgi:stearoyl-CoA desaturase (delta-9 desaturase)
MTKDRYQRTHSRGGRALYAPQKFAVHPLARLDWWLAWVVTLVPPFGAVAAVVLAFSGLTPGWFEVVLVASLYLLTLVGVEVGFHRLFTHRSFQAARPVRVALAMLGSMAFQGPVIWWAATHRRHHQYSDQPGDPHSPNLRAETWWGRTWGLWHAHIGWLFVADSTRGDGWRRYAPDLYRDPAIFWVQVRYFYWLTLGFVIPAVAGGIWYGSWAGALLGLLWGGFVRVFLVNHVFFWCINSVTHRFGTRPFTTGDHSTNNVWLAVPTLGESWHNNHHAFPSVALLDFSWWQLDLGGWVIRALELLGLAWDVRRPERSAIVAKRLATLTPPE